MQKKLVWQCSILIAVGVLGSVRSTQAFEPQFKAPRKIDPQVIRFCVNQLLYDLTSLGGNPAGDRTIIDPSSAAVACQGVQSKDESLEIKKCVNSLLYDRTFFNGKPAGDRTILDPASAARACSRCEHD